MAMLAQPLGDSSTVCIPPVILLVFGFQIKDEKMPSTASVEIQDVPAHDWLNGFVFADRAELWRD
jgi:hypothetical protein